MELNTCSTQIGLFFDYSADNLHTVFVYGKQTLSKYSVVVYDMIC